MLNPYTRYISEEKCIVGRCHLMCRHELAEGNTFFRTLCESTIRCDSLSLHRAQCETALTILNVITTLSAFEKVHFLHTKPFYFPTLLSKYHAKF